MARYGKIRIKLDELLKKSGMSKNKLSQRAEMQRTQLNHYCNNTPSHAWTQMSWHGSAPSWTAKSGTCWNLFPRRTPIPNNHT